VAERTGNPALADTGWSDDQQILVSLDPLAGDEPLEQRLIEAARRLHVDVLDDGVLPQLGEAQAVHQSLVLPFGCFPVDEQSEPFVKAECGDVGLPLLFIQGLSHAGQPQRDKAARSWMCEHNHLSSLQW
jgi:hypothetical protein